MEFAPRACIRQRDVRHPGCNYKLHRHLCKAFDPARTTHLMLVVFPLGWTGQRTTSFAETTITIRHEDVRLYLVEVDEFNEIFPEGRAEAETKKWAFVILDDEWLKQHRVH
ncbi:hypothetical protein ABZZ20_29180 [Streptomyces sp. NPDC006430]|uniref:hypothetical protein n=1 Tax=Streptomyces sp. NPDC006430 TaxID=3154299 RepID=UPI0033AC6ECA